MEILNAITQFISKLFQWWFIVTPWEQAIHVHRGKRTRVLGQGMYFNIPFIDQVYIQTTRMRTIEVPMQNVTTKDGICVSLTSYISYSIADIMVLYKSLYHPERTLSMVMQGYVSEYIREHEYKDITLPKVEEYCSSKIASFDYGLKDIMFRVTTFAAVKTFRLIQDNSYNYSEGLKMEAKK